MPSNIPSRTLQRDSHSFQELSDDSSDSGDAGAPIKFKRVARKRRHADVVTPQKSKPGVSNPKPALTRGAPLTPPPTMPNSVTSISPHSGTPAGRRGGIVKAFESLSVVESPSVSPIEKADPKCIVISDTETESAESDEDSGIVGMTPIQQLPTPDSSSSDVDPTTRLIRRFSEQSMDSELGCSIIAHCAETQAMFDEHQIAWGTQYELARGVCGGAWTWEGVRSRIDRLKGDNLTSAPNVLRVMRDQDVDNSFKPLWKQLDLEEKAILENKSRGLGLMESKPDWLEEDRWHGGQIQQVARLVKKNGLFRISPEPMEMRRSHRFARFYGSRRFIQVKIPDTYMKDGNFDNADESASETIKKFFAQKFILCGRCFVPFHAKEGSVYLMETDDNYERSPQTWCGDQHRLSLSAFLNWHNPLKERQNYEQYISKWVTRFALGLSNSVPALEFEAKNVFFIKDLVADDWPSDKKAPAEKLMTDGCGFINRAGMTAIAKGLSRSDDEVTIPSGVQGRIGGSKGFWILEPHDSSNEPKIWIRDSQKKIHYPYFDRSHLIFDLLATSGLSSEVPLTEQSVQNLFANGIPGQTLVTMMEDSLTDTIKPLLEWNDVVVLTNAINRAGNVAGTRAQRAAAARSRALGLSGRDWDDEKHEETIGEYIDVSLTTYTGRNLYSQAPLGLQEIALELVQAGFTPSTNQLLYEKMKYIIQNTIKSAVEDCRIPSKYSFGAYVVPDPFGILKGDEIYFQFSRIRKHAVTGLPFTVLEGDVVVGRYPIRLPSDMRKVKAVNKTRLSNYMDVIVIPTKGNRSLASLLAGGDMDGDEWVVFYEPTIVQPFQNQPFTDEPHDLAKNFHTEDIEKIPDFCRRMPTQQEFLQKLLSNIEKAQVGIYSTFHENAIVKHGYHHTETIRLAYIFAVLLDSSKNGKRIDPGVFQADRKLYRGSSFAEHQSPHPNILKILENAARKKGAELMLLYSAADQRLVNRSDPALKEPYDFLNRPHMTDKPFPGKELSFAELCLIRHHVNAVHEKYKQAMSQKRAANNATNGWPGQKNKKSSRAKSDQKDPALEPARLFYEPIPDIYLLRANLDEVKASYAYYLDPKFGFDVAFGLLCVIKAKSCPGGLVPSIRTIDEARAISPQYLKAINR